MVTLLERYKAVIREQKGESARVRSSPIYRYSPPRISLLFVEVNDLDSRAVKKKLREVDFATLDPPCANKRAGETTLKAAQFRA